MAVDSPFLRLNPRAKITGDVIDVEDLAQKVRGCNACTARQEARLPVPGVFGMTAKKAERGGVMFVGRNPGKTEDISGAPFLGPSGGIFDEWLIDCGLSRNEVFVTNLALCHTIDDRELTDTEISTCVTLHLQAYLERIKPLLVVPMGKPACEAIIGGVSLKVDHGKVFRHKGGFWAMPCYHPGSVLYDFRQKAVLAFEATQIRRFMYWKGEYANRLLVE